MAVLDSSIYSDSLEMKTGISFIVPYEQRKRENTDVKVIYLLHGLSDDYKCWLYQSNIARYAADNGIMVVMPEVHRSWYTDMKFGGRYFTYISEELPLITENIFGFKHKRENTFIAGLSMGGYGALKCAFKRPDFYNAVAGFSSACDILGRRNEPRFYNLDFSFGKGETPDSENLMVLAEDIAKLNEKDRPKIYTACGFSDYLYEDNQDLCKRLNDLKINHTYEEWEGDHNWDFWDKAIQNAIEFFGLKQ